jgi:glutathione peroxidase
MALDPNIQLETLEGQNTTLQAYAGKVLLIVNVASKCGLTPHYKGLESLYQEFKDQGVEILGFPCNQFGSQEPGTATEIRTFCTLEYPVSFDLMAKCDVNGDEAHPLWKALKKECPGILGTEAIKWNFTKFLVNRQLEVVERFAPTTEPLELKSSLQALL